MQGRGSLSNRIRIEHRYGAPYKVRAASGQPLHSYFAQLRSILTGGGGAELARYLAEPSIDNKTNTIDWFTRAKDMSTVRPFSALAAAEQEELLKRVQANHKNIADLINQYRDKGGENFQRAAIFLEEIVSYPDEKHIYFVDGEPCYVYWSHEQENIFDVDGEITRLKSKRLNQNDNGVKGGKEPVGHHLYFGSFLHFVGAVSFFSIAVASLLVATSLVAFTWIW